ncbi:hypothetical protein EXIGLDRAFT_730130 [Exidia glandulosa HHB12029]|uniref:Uncharacterized protein n=1 Tax=Exidia glandulosa HHB12029 TaxID=1314781 RepID=A0A165CBF0_EXIGL|nr:hypothetical protein EXIGLDRAFT_730130 [Exidia glandulosa HHB12029]
MRYCFTLALIAALAAVVEATPVMQNVARQGPGDWLHVHPESVDAKDTKRSAVDGTLREDIGDGEWPVRRSGDGDWPVAVEVDAKRAEPAGVHADAIGAGDWWRA